MSHQPPPAIVAAARRARDAHQPPIPVSVQLAQWAQESGWGTADSGKNNPFNVKALQGQPSSLVWTHEYVHGVRQKVQAAFRDYPSLEAAFDDHARLLATSTHYARARAALPDVFGFVAGLSVYATDPDYVKNLTAIIRGSNLTQYD